MDLSNSVSMTSLPLLCILLIMKYSSSIKSFVSFLIYSSTNKTDLDGIIFSLKNVQEFQDRVWMYNCGVIAHFAFDDEITNDNCLIVHPDKLLMMDYSLPYYYFDDEPDNIVPNFFTSLFSTYFNYWISTILEENIRNHELNEVIKSVFNINGCAELFSMTIENTEHIRKLNERFDRLYTKYYKDFKDGVCKSKIKNRLSEAITPRLLELEVNRYFDIEQQFIGPSSIDDSSKTNHHNEKKFQKSRHTKHYSSERKKKLKTDKHRSSPKNKKEKYINLVVYA